MYWSTEKTAACFTAKIFKNSRVVPAGSYHDGRSFRLRIARTARSMHEDKIIARQKTWPVDKLSND